MIAKSTAIKDRGGKSGGRAAKAVGLTSGDLRRVRVTGLSGSQGRDRGGEVSRRHSRRSNSTEGLNGWKREVETGISKVPCGRKAVLSVLYASR